MRTIRRCTVCGIRPPAMREIPFCFQCWPGGPVTPPPCRRCGSREDYYTSGLCARCHPHAPGAKSQAWRSPGRLAAPVVVGSCLDCLGWGVMRTHGWRCPGCRAWRETYGPDGPDAACRICARLLPVDRSGMCRPCRKQRSMIAHREGVRPVDPTPQQVQAVGHQLFLAVAGMWHQQGAGKRPYVKKTSPADLSLLRPVQHRQLVLLEVPRDMRLGLARGFPPPPDAGLEAAFHQFVREHAAHYGWSLGKAERIQRGIRIMLGLQDTPGAPIRRSDVALLSSIKYSAAVVADVLAEAGMLDDDRVPPVERWFPIQIADLPEPMRDELTLWFQVIRTGSATPPRMRPRSDPVTATQLRWALPALRQWARTYQSLRQIGRDDVQAVLPADAVGRSCMLQGLRSIFRILKGRNAVFVNPTARLSAPAPDKQAPAAADLTTLKAALDSDNPAEALITALLAFHAVRIYQLTSIRLDDIHDGRLHIGAQVIVLAAPVRRRLTAYLDHRAQTWPTSVNPYLFLHARNWGTARHVTIWWVRHQLRMAGQLIRTDRIFNEAVATGGDVRALCDLFGLSVAGAYKYTAVVDQIIDPRAVATGDSHQAR